MVLYHCSAGSYTYLSASMYLPYNCTIRLSSVFDFHRIVPKHVNSIEKRKIHLSLFDAVTGSFERLLGLILI